MPYKRILVPISGTEDDFRAVDLAAVVAMRKDADVTLVYVVEVRQSLPLDADLPETVSEGEQALARSEKYAREHIEQRGQRLHSELLQARSAGAAIVDEAIERDIDVIVMASRNRKHMGNVTLGDTVPYIMKHAPCAVILTRSGDPSWE